MFNDNLAALGFVVLVTTHNRSSTVSYQSGATNTLYFVFVENGRLNGQTPTYEAKHSVAFSHDLGKVSISTSVTFAVKQYRINLVDYLDQTQTGYHLSQYSNVLEAVDGFLGDYEAANQESQRLDMQI